MLIKRVGVKYEQMDTFARIEFFYIFFFFTITITLGQ